MDFAACSCVRYSLAASLSSLLGLYFTYSLDLERRVRHVAQLSVDLREQEDEGGLTVRRVNVDCLREAFCASGKFWRWKRASRENSWNTCRRLD